MPPASENPWLTADVLRGGAYDDRFAALAAAGEDVHGEARFVAALPVSSVLDAGCGTGRIAVELARRGLTTVGVDIDPAMLASAKEKAPALEWVLGDLAVVDLGRRFDAVLLAGNVMLFVEPASRGDVVSNLARHLLPSGLLIAGFSLGRGVDPAAYDRLAEAAGCRLVERFSSWDRAPFGEGSDYAVSVHRLEEARGMAPHPEAGGLPAEAGPAGPAEPAEPAEPQ